MTSYALLSMQLLFEVGLMSSFVQFKKVEVVLLHWRNVVINLWNNYYGKDE